MHKQTLPSFFWLMIVCVAGLMSALIMLPVNILIVAVFRSCRQRYSRHLYHVHLDTLKMHLAMGSYDESELRTMPYLKTGLAKSQSHYLAYEPQESSYMVVRRYSREETEAGQSQSRARLLKEPFSPKGKCPDCFLPWWCVYIGWVSKCSRTEFFFSSAVIL